jgi:hypothetical protein
VEELAVAFTGKASEWFERVASVSPGRRRLAVLAATDTD